jgi:hypothetical protein
MFVTSTQILSPIAAYLTFAANNLVIDTAEWSVFEDGEGWGANYTVGDYVAGQILEPATQSPIITLQHTSSDNETINGSKHGRQVVRLTSAGIDTALTRSNRDAAIAFIQYGLQTDKLHFPGLQWSGLYTLLSKPAMQYDQKHKVAIAATTIMIGLSRSS